MTDQRRDSGAVAPLPARGRGAPDPEQLLAALHALRSGPRDGDFWQRFATTAAALCRARAVVVVAGGDPGTDSWSLTASDCDPGSTLADGWQQALAGLADRVLERGFALDQGTGGSIVGVRVLGDATPRLLLLEIPARERAQLNELVLRARLVADLPEPGSTGSGGSGGSGGSDVGDDRLLELLDLLLQVMRESRFGAAALALVNGLAAQLGCSQAALGWSDGGYVRSQAISHLDRFERKTENVQLLEAAFEEALDQESDLDYPGDRDSGFVLLAHSRFCRTLGYEHAVSLVLRRGDEDPEAVILLGGAPGEIAPEALPAVRFALHLLLPWLANLREQDRWAGARALAWCRETAGRAVGLEHVGRKLAALVAAMALLFVLLGTWPHEVEAPAELRTDSTRLISAPYDGFFDEIRVTAGDDVTGGQLLGTLDVQDLYLQESEVRADIRRYGAEADRARAAGEMADMEIANARQAQARARLDRVLYLLEQSRLEAPFDGVIVDGERSELLGTPVRQGDQLFRIARIEGLYAVLQVPERDVRYLEGATGGELRLLSQPDVDIPFTIETLIPMAQVRGQEGNHFLVKVRLDAEARNWWRPGMAGMARIDAGRANIAWLLSHRLIDQLRITFWW